MRLFRILALALAVISPLLLTVKISNDRANAPVYLVRIEGYDPRDLLYGHYLMFRFVPEKSPQRDSFPDDMDALLDDIDPRYYVPEDKALVLEDILRDENRYVSIEVGVPESGKAFMRDLYIDGKPMQVFLRDFEDRVDLDGEIGGE